MSHEQSETKQIGKGWYNVYGRNTENADMPLYPRFGFEKSVYPDSQEADKAAALRSAVQGQLPTTDLVYHQQNNQNKQNQINSYIQMLFKFLGL